MIGGSSAVAPLWAGLVALAKEKPGNPVGWDAGTGRGVRQRQKLIAALKAP